MFNKELNLQYFFENTYKIEQLAGSLTPSAHLI